MVLSHQTLFSVLLLNSVSQPSTHGKPKTLCCPENTCVSFLSSFPTFGISAQNLESNPQNNVGGKHCEVLSPLKSWLISIRSQRENQELNACSLESKQLGPRYYPSFLGCLLLQSGKVHEGQATACLQERFGFLSKLVNIYMFLISSSFFVGKWVIAQPKVGTKIHRCWQSWSYQIFSGVASATREIIKKKQWITEKKTKQTEPSVSGFMGLRLVGFKLPPGQLLSFNG